MHALHRRNEVGARNKSRILSQLPIGPILRPDRTASLRALYLHCRLLSRPPFPLVGGGPTERALVARRGARDRRRNSFPLVVITTRAAGIPLSHCSYPPSIYAMDVDSTTLGRVSLSLGRDHPFYQVCRALLAHIPANRQQREAAELRTGPRSRVPLLRMACLSSSARGTSRRRGRPRRRQRQYPCHAPRYRLDVCQLPSSGIPRLETLGCSNIHTFYNQWHIPDRNPRSHG